ncbi:unnamed protein product [Ectocarpus sp. 4 AP-2014]|uniref:EsV-1-89 n=1 Tax=Ectocarpus siliculosus virus 1 (isolate New Zealand/Kaikoura/1988) TaxID=654926 RepID=Q8QNI8_ESV1K|nr:EsV-1-89 [Ectocarpus siliculosus virus 1]AAK14507.1 EsV-1-89 [Ectocarpus siliculosus virus 1]
MNSTQDGTGAEPDSSFGYGLNYNPMDPLNMYPHHETGEEVYGPPPLFGINPHDPFNMKPFNPNAFSGLFGAPAMATPTPAPGVMNTVGPNPFTPLLQPMAPAMPMAPPSHVAPPMVAPMGGMNPLLMAATVSALSKDSSFNAGAAPSSSFDAGAAPSSSFDAGAAPSSSFDAGAAPSSSFDAGAAPSSSYHYMNALYPYYMHPLATHVVSPQNPHPTDPNNQYPNPLTGSMTDPGPALAGGYNVYDPQNVIGAPPAFSERARALEHNRAAVQSQSPYAPYIMNQVPVPPS